MCRPACTVSLMWTVAGRLHLFFKDRRNPLHPCQLQFQKGKQTQFEQTDLTVEYIEAQQCESKTSGTLDQHLSMGLGFLNGISVGNATSTRVTPRCSTESVWIKSLHAECDRLQGRVNCSDPHREIRPHLPGEQKKKKKKHHQKKCLYQQDTNRITGREALSTFDWQANWHFVQYLTGTHSKLFEEVYFQRELVESQVSLHVHV